MSALSTLFLLLPLLTLTVYYHLKTKNVRDNILNHKQQLINIHKRIRAEIDSCSQVINTYITNNGDLKKKQIFIAQVYEEIIKDTKESYLAIKRYNENYKGLLEDISELDKGFCTKKNEINIVTPIVGPWLKSYESFMGNIEKLDKQWVGKWTEIENTEKIIPFVPGHSINQASIEEEKLLVEKMEKEFQELELMLKFDKDDNYLNSVETDLKNLEKETNFLVDYWFQI